MKKLPAGSVTILGLILILGAYIVSGTLVFRNAMDSGEGLGALADNRRVVRIMHWQLEPGYREALQAVIDEYNTLPHVRAASVEVRQLAVSDRIYGQVLNIHTVSGTAPDLCEQGGGRVARRIARAQFFEPLGEVAEQPNPYNAEAYLPDGLDPELREKLPTLPWRETFVDGMQGGWNEFYQDYFSAPTSYLGESKLYYNLELTRDAKTLLAKALAASPRPAWVQRVLLSEGDGEARGYITDTPALRAWLDGPAVPDTLGRLLALCAAIEELADQTGQSRLVPIAGGGLIDQTFADRYLVPFTSHIGVAADVSLDGYVNSAESWMGYLNGSWSFDDPEVRGYYECIRTICRYLPVGFLGLDREQARRRFIRGQAAILATGAWDLNSVLRQTQGEPVTPETPAQPGERLTEVDGVPHRGYRFSIGIGDFPLPVAGERWAELVSAPPNSAGQNAGAPYLIYQRSPNIEWALDFLQYLTSCRINEQFNRDAGWMPCVLGARFPERLLPFAPNYEGLAPRVRLDVAEFRSNFKTRYEGQLKNYLAGDLTYNEFVANVVEIAEDPRLGARRLWYDLVAKQVDMTRNYEQLIGVQSARGLLLGAQDADAKLKRAVLQTAYKFNGRSRRADWMHLLPGENFPEY